MQQSNSDVILCFYEWQAAMDFVVEEDLKAHLTCWYIQKYVKENPQPQYFEHIYQWLYIATERDEKEERDSQERNMAWCFGFRGWYTTKDLPVIVKHDNE